MTCFKWGNNSTSMESYTIISSQLFERGSITVQMRTPLLMSNYSNQLHSVTYLNQSLICTWALVFVHRLRVCSACLPTCRMNLKILKKNNVIGGSKLFPVNEADNARNIISFVMIIIETAPQLFFCTNILHKHWACDLQAVSDLKNHKGWCCIWNLKPLALRFILYHVTSPAPCKSYNL